MKKPLKDFLDIENTYNLLDVKYDGQSIWAYNRVEFYFRNFIGSPKKLKRNQSIKRLISILYSVVGLIGFNWKRKSAVFFLHPRLNQENGYYFCKFSNDLILKYEQAGASVGVVEMPFHGTHFYNKKNSRNHLPILFIKLIARIEVKLKHYFDLYDPGVRGAIEEFSGLIGNIYKIGEEQKYWEEKFFETYLYCSSLEKYIKFFLIKQRPQQIYEVVYYDPLIMKVNEIAFSMGIQTYEFQHGFISAHHVAYNLKDPRCKYTWIPTYLYSFNNKWIENIKWPIPTEKRIHYGYPFLEQFAKSNKIDNNCRKGILLINQPIIRQQLLGLAKDLSQSVDLGQYVIYYKLHPEEYDQRAVYEEWLAGTGVIIISLEEPLYNLFLKTQIQIGVYSTVLYEGLSFNLKTIIMKWTNYEYYAGLIDAKHCKLAENSQQVLHIIKAWSGE